MVLSSRVPEAETRIPANPNFSADAQQAETSVRCENGIIRARRFQTN